MKNIVHTNVASLVGSWYFFYPTVPMRDPTWVGFRQSMIYSFGSMAFAALFVPPIKLIRLFITQLYDMGPCFYPITSCALDALDGLSNIFNDYSFTHIAVYGRSYCSSASSSIVELRSKGTQILLTNDNVVAPVLFWGAFAVGGISGSVAYAIAFKVLIGSVMPALWAGLAFFMGIFHDQYYTGSDSRSGKCDVGVLQ